MNLGLFKHIACIVEIVCAFFGGEGTQDFADGGANGFDGSGPSLSQEMFEF